MIGEKLGSFRIESVLGMGGMGVVYRAVNEKTGKPTAVKVIKKGFAALLSERFGREAAMLMQFDHPNIVRFLAHGSYQGTYYLAMELIQGKTLEHILESRGALPWTEVVELGLQFCDALQYAHEHGVVHRDLKPSNLMVTDEGQVKLTDFGIAKDLEATPLPTIGRAPLLGTPAYMAPEQIRGTPEVSYRSDLYALGAVLYQMLTGRQPFEAPMAIGLMYRHLHEPPPRPSQKLVDIPKTLDDLVISLMAKTPQDRASDASAVALALKAVIEMANKGEALNIVRSVAADPSATLASADTEGGGTSGTRRTVLSPGGHGVREGVGRVDLGGCPPRSPTDPGVHVKCTRFLIYDFAAPRNRLRTTRAFGRP